LLHLHDLNHIGQLIIAASDNPSISERAAVMYPIDSAMILFKENIT